MQIFIYLIFLLWLGRIFCNLLSYIHLWWVKEYRIDRMLIHFKTDQGKRLLFLPFRKPLISPKTITLFILSIFSLIICFYILPGFWLFKLICIDLLSFPIVSIWVIFLKLPTYMYHQILIYLAIGKLRSHKPMKVIAITGSFGKTSTKEFLATILERKYNILKTEASKNSPIGIAEVILKKLQPDTEIFIVEMGAYKKGEITKMCQMVNPSIGIITAINAQHQDLFGSIENTMKAKYELIESLPKNGIAIFNADNEKTLEMTGWAKKEKRRVWLYSQENRKSIEYIEKFIQANDVKVGLKHIIFKINVDNKSAPVTVSLLGQHQVSNVLAAISGALALGMKFADIINATGNIKPFSKTMEPILGIKGATFINDTFNNNPEAAKAAIDYLSQTKGKRILVFQPMIELGSFAKKSHEEVGKEAAKVCDQIYLTNKNYFEDFKKGVEKVAPNKKIFVGSRQEVVKQIQKELESGVTVLFKGKEAEPILKDLLKKI